MELTNVLTSGANGADAIRQADSAAAADALTISVTLAAFGDVNNVIYVSSTQVLKESHLRTSRPVVVMTNQPTWNCQQTIRKFIYLKRQIRETETCHVYEVRLKHNPSQGWIFDDCVCVV